MAKKKVEEAELEPEVAHNVAVAEALGADDIELDIPDDRSKAEKAAAETAKTPEPKTEPATTPEIDTATLKAELKGEVSKELTAQIVESLTGKTVEDNPNTPPWEKEKRNPRDYTEIALWAKDQAKSEVKAEAEQEQKAQQESQKATEDRQKADEARVHSYWDAQLQELESSGKIPAITDQADPNDPGRKARLTLFESLAQVRQERATKGLPDTLSLKEVYYENYKSPASQPAGADAPIAGNRRAVTPDSTDETINYHRDLAPGKRFGDWFYSAFTKK